MDNRVRYRSLFWPVVLIGVGVLWLLSNLGYLSAARIYDLWRLWPVLLIAGGVDLLIARRIPLIGALFGLLVVALVGYTVFFGLPIVAGAQPNVVTEHYTTPIDQAQKATLNLDFWSDPVSIHGLQGSNDVIDARITHTGSIQFSGTGSNEKAIHLSHSSNFSTGMFWGFVPETRSDIGLTPSIPLDLRVNTASGSSDMDLSALQLSALSVNSGSGSLRMTLPRSGVTGNAQVNSASGSVDITIPANARLNLETNSGSGSLHIHVPSNAALKIDALDDGSGSLSLPSGMVQTRSGMHETGTWETSDYATAQQKITITLQGVGSGSISIDR